MTGMWSYDGKQRRAQRRRNHFAKDLEAPQYRDRVVQEKKKHLVDKVVKKEACTEAETYFEYDGKEMDEYEWQKALGLTTKE